MSRMDDEKVRQDCVKVSHMLFDLISGEVICLSGNAAWSFSRLQLRGLLNYLCPVISNLKMECVLGIACNDFVILASDMTNAHSIIVNKQDEDKMFKLSDRLLMAVTGESGDTTIFAEFIARNFQLYKMRNGYELSPPAAASFTRRQLADSLRSKTPYQVNFLLAGFSERTGPELYWMDYLASMVKAPYAHHGYGGLFSIGIMDRYYRPDMTREEAYEILQKCVAEIQKRLIVSLPNFQVKVVDKDGIHAMDVIKSKNLA